MSDIENEVYIFKPFIPLLINSIDTPCIENAYNAFFKNHIFYDI